MVENALIFDDEDEEVQWPCMSSCGGIEMFVSLAVKCVYMYLFRPGEDVR